jgi:membrane protease YdiL (CAAX protease family)
VTIPAAQPDAPPRWPAWYGIAALALALVLAIVAGGVVYAVARMLGDNAQPDSPAVNIVATVVQDLLLVATALWLASQTSRPKPWQFGLRPTPFWRGVGWAAAAFALYFTFTVAYVAAVHPNEKQTTLQDLGAGSSGLATLVIGILVVGIAPFAEEFFFRGFFYGALRSRFSFVGAALIDGVVFGLVHAPTGIEAVPPLIALGFAFCMAYEATGSIFPVIALHALNNMVAFGSDKDGSWPVAGMVAAAVLTACVTLPRMLAQPRAATG